MVNFKSYNFDKNELVKREEYLYSTIDFRIDLRNDTLEVFGNGADVSKVITVFRNSAVEFTGIQNYKTNLFKLLPLLKDQTNNIIIEKLIVNYFKHGNGLIGRYEMEFLDEREAWKQLETYQNDIAKASVNVFIDDKEIKRLSLNNVGKISFKGTESEFFTILNLIKSITKNKNT